MRMKHLLCKWWIPFDYYILCETLPWILLLLGVERDQRKREYWLNNLILPHIFSLCSNSMRGPLSKFIDCNFLLSLSLVLVIGSVKTVQILFGVLSRYSSVWSRSCYRILLLWLHLLLLVLKYYKNKNMNDKSFANSYSCFIILL